MLRALCASCALCFVCALVITPVSLRSFAEGPFPGFTGGFKEPTCQQCHFGNDLNAPGGKLTLSGVPAVYEAGQSYAITVVLAREKLRKAGFQLAARFARGKAAGTDAGTLSVSGADLQLVKGPDNKVTYVQHTPAGTKARGPGSLTWRFRWVAPKAAMPVRFDLAANASNDDESPIDDFIYTASATAKGR
ncbi:MAG TPA: choice-of-anchor V domain-containing protein [Vicinamibacterales bacterium]|nr:choice-of-anchor V domain-containing protein [Vicinamibacterales bacterium]